MNSCHVSHQIDNYAHQRGVDEAKEDAFNERVKSMMELGEDYDPFETNNFSEGFGEISHKDIAVIGGLMRNACYEQSARLLASHINAYWVKQAENQLIKGKDNEQKL